MRRPYSTRLLVLLNLAVAAGAGWCFIAPNPAAAAFLVAATAISIVLWARSILVDRYPDWRTLGPGGLAYIAVWAIIETGHGRVGTIELPDWFWQPVRLPLIGATTPTGMAVPMVGAVLFALVALFAFRRSSFALLVLGEDVLFINLYWLLASTLPEAGLLVNAPTASVVTLGLATWQMVWLPTRRREAGWRGISVDVAAAPAAVIDMVSDVSRRPRWMASVKADELVEGITSEQGAVYLETIRSSHVRTSVKVFIREKVPARRVAIAVVAPHPLAEEYDVRPTPQGSELSLAHRWEVSYAVCLLGGRWWWLRGSPDRERRERANLTALAALMAE